MRESYWSTYCDLVRSGYYYWHYREQSRRINFLINAFLCTAAISSVVTWSIWKNFPGVLGFLLALSQVIGALKDLLPYSARITSVDLLYPEILSLQAKMERDWYYVDTNDEEQRLNEEKINDLIYEYKSKYNELEDKYTSIANFPHSYFCSKKADRNLCGYMYEKYGLSPLESSSKSKEVHYETK